MNTRVLKVIGKSQQQIRVELKDKPDQLRLYENKLLQATFNENKAEHFYERETKNKSNKFHNLIESRCEGTLEILQEIVVAEVSMYMCSNIGLYFGHRRLIIDLNS